MPIVVLDGNLRVINCNAAAELIWGTLLSKSFSVARPVRLGLVICSRVRLRHPIPRTTAMLPPGPASR